MDLYSRPPGLDATRRAKVADAGARLPVDVDGYLGLCERAAATARGDGAPVFVAWRQKCGAIDPAELLDVAFAKSSRAFFWSSPSDGASFVAAGSACDLVGRGTTRFGQVRHARRQALSRMLHGGLPGGDTARTPSFVGGFSFDVAQGDGSSPLPDALMWLPSVVVGRDDDDCTLTLHARVGPDDRIDRADAANAIARLVAALAATGGRTDDRRSDPGHVSMVDRPDSREWAALVDAAQHRVRREKLDGIAVSRQLELISSRRFDVASALRFLARRDPAVTVFGCRVGDGAFLGATPQRLAGLRRGKVRATSLTGTTARGETSEQDARLAVNLVEDPRRRREHAVAVDALRQTLARVCTDVRGPQRPTLLASPDAQHLVAEVTGTLAEQRHGVLDLVERLHPAASVGGLPRRDALRWLRDVEDLDRGWYAGPIGWTDDRGDGDFAVAIGSAQVCGDAATLYAGCGVAGGADPAAAFAETRLQLRTMLSALGAAPPDRLADDDAEPAT